LEHALAQSEEQKPKGFWRTLFSWFGFGK
jgi:hypothetical protein